MSEHAYHAYARGLELLDREHPHAAAIALEQARDLEPDKGSIRESLGRAYFQAGRVGEASDEFERAVEIDPVNDYAHFGLGLCLTRRGERAAARGHLKLAVAMRPGIDHYERALTQVSGD